MKEVWHLEQH